MNKANTIPKDYQRIEQLPGSMQCDIVIAWADAEEDPEICKLSLKDLYKHIRKGNHWFSYDGILKSTSSGERTD